MKNRHLLLALFAFIALSCEKPDYRPAGTVTDAHAVEAESPLTDFVIEETVLDEETDPDPAAAVGADELPEDDEDESVPGTPLIRVDLPTLPAETADGN